MNDLLLYVWDHLSLESINGLIEGMPERVSRARTTKVWHQNSGCVNIFITGQTIKDTYCITLPCGEMRSIGVLRSFRSWCDCYCTTSAHNLAQLMTRSCVKTAQLPLRTPSSQPSRDILLSQVNVARDKRHQRSQFH